MLVIDVEETEGYDNSKNEFVNVPAMRLHFEHSLLSLSEWEAHFHKPFLSEEQKTTDETIYYMRCMCQESDNLTDEEFTIILSNPNIIKQIQEYIGDSMTATTIKSDPNGKKNKEVMTAEVIYYYMIALTIPKEFEKWHLNRLITLIEVCSIKNQPPKKMSQAETYARNAKLNAERKARLHSKG